MNPNIYSTCLFLLSGGMFTIFIYSVSQTRNKIASIFSLVCLVITIYTFFYSFELMSYDISLVKAFLKIEYFGVVFIPTLWFKLANRFYYKKMFDLKTNILMFTVPFLMLFATSTNDYHHLVYKNIYLEKVGSLYLAQLEKGIVYKLYVIYTYTMIFLGQLLFYKAWKNSKNIRKKQALIFLVGSSVPIIFSIFYLTGKTPGGIDPMPLSYAIFSVLNYISIFKFEFLEMKEIVREISFEQISEGIVVIDENNRIIDFNSTAQKTFSFLNRDHIGLNIEIFSKEIFSLEKLFYEVKYLEKIYEFRNSIIKENQRVIGRIYIFTDISNKKAMINKLQYNAKYDFLSQVYNRHELFELAEIEVYKATKRNEKLAILMIDIDYFKKINDSYGHITGDKVIKKLAQICKTELKTSDIIGRYGGEEFLIVIIEESLENVKNIANKIRKKVETAQVKVESSYINFTISTGIKFYSGEENYSLSELIDMADKALYCAKNNGRNRIEIF